VDRAANRVAFRLGEHDTGWRTADYTEAVEREQRHAAAEDRRLLYVACTRARDHLVLPLAPAADGSLAACLAGQIPPAEDVIGGTIIDDQFVHEAAMAMPTPKVEIV
jgi:ATP-dependent exoDNAse (exonuclease V) beta subunit